MLCGLVLLAAPAAHAQTDAGRLLEETRRDTRPALPPATAPRLVDAPVRPTITMPEGATVTVSGFRITGAVSFPEAQLAALVQPWVGRKLDLNGLNEAAGALTRHYQSRGHLLTYAYLPAQRVADGVIELAVLEGRLESVQIVAAQEVRLRDEVVQAHTAGLPTQPPLLQADVERQLLLLNDIPGVTARAAFTPGSSTGAADMVVSVAEDEPMQLRAELNNHGSRSTGEYRAGVTVQLRDLSGWGDSLQARALLSNKAGLVSGSLSGGLPMGGDGYRLGFSLSRLTYELTGNFRALGAVGTANTWGLDGSYPFIRSADMNLGARVAYERKQLTDEIRLAGLSLSRKRNDTLDAGLNFDLRDDLGGLTAASIVGSMGHLRLLQADKLAEDQDPATGLRTARSYRKLNAQVVRQQALTGPFSLYARAAGQATGGNLDSSEKLGLGGPAGVRAYAPGEASVDQGGLLSLEARYAMDYLGGNLVWALFHDRAEGLTNRRPVAAAGNDPRLSGSGLAVQWNGGDIGLNASLAWRHTRTPTAEGGDPKPRLYLQLVVTP